MASEFINEKLSDTLVTYMVLKRLVKPWSEWESYKLGIIDDKGEMIKTPTTSEELSAWNSLEKFTRNLKRVMEKFVGKGKLAHYLTAMYLLRDSLKPFADYHNLLNESLDTLTAQKQLNTLRLFRNLDEKYLVYNKFSDLEFNILTHYQKVQASLDELHFTEGDFI